MIMELQTKVNIESSLFKIEPQHHLLFVGSCFADNIGRKFTDWQFRTIANPYGVMYNPASVLHTIKRWTLEPYTDDATPRCRPDVAIFTLGTNHVYILNETGEIVDNCQKRPQKLFTEKILSIKDCADYLCQAVDILRSLNTSVQVIITVSPIRYAKYGFHASQLSKASLLLATEEVTQKYNCVTYFPAYEIVNDELRDYRFYKPDMLHPSEQAVDYIFQRFCDTYLAEDSIRFMQEWQPIQNALTHRPFNPEDPEYKRFIDDAHKKEEAFKKKWLCR